MPRRAIFFPVVLPMPRQSGNSTENASMEMSAEYAFAAPMVNR